MLGLTVLAFVMVWAVLLLGAESPEDAPRRGERQLVANERGEPAPRS